MIPPIDLARVASIFRTLAIKESNSDARRLSSQETALSIKIGEDKKHSKETLKQAIKKRLLSLKSNSDDFNANAPRIVITEVLLWEFGENIITHPNFNFILQNISTQIDGHKDLHLYLQKLIKELVD